MATGGEVGDAGPVNGLIFRASVKNEQTTQDNNKSCKLDMRTRLRMSEAENAVLQQQISLLISEQSTVEEASTTFYSNWQFALTECGRIIEEKNEALAKLAAIQSSTAAIPANSRKSRREVEQLRLALDTQNRVCEQLEQERDRANDDFQSCRAQLTTLLDNYHVLSTASAAVARERDAAQQEVLVLRQQLVQWTESQDNIHSLECNDELQKELTHCKERLRRIEHLRNQSVKDKQAADSLVTLWQHKHENVLKENRELKEEVLAAQERISFLQEQLAMLRLHQRSGMPPVNIPGEQEASNSSSSPTLQATNNSADEISWI